MSFTSSKIPITPSAPPNSALNQMRAFVSSPKDTSGKVWGGFERFLLLITLDVLIPVLIWSNITGAWTGAFCTAALITLYSGYKLCELAFKRESSLLQLTFWLFVYCWLGLAAAGQIKGHIFPWGDAAQSDENLLFTTAVVIAGLLSYELGLNRSSKSTRQSFALRIVSTPSLTRFLLATTASVFLSFISLELQGGLGVAFQTRYEAGKAAELGTSAKSAALLEGAVQHTPPIIALLVTIYLLLFARYRGSRRHLLVTVLVALILYNLVANYPPSLARVNLGSDLMAVLLLIVHRKPRLRPTFVLGMALVLLVAFPYSDYFRTAERYTAADVQSPASLLTTKGDYDAFQMLSSTIATVNDDSIDYGYHLLGSVLFFVPRTIWEHKPYGTGQTVGEHLGYTNLNLSCPLWAEFYYACGIPAVLTGFWILGMATGNLERYLFVRTHHAAAIVLAYFAAFQIFLLRGDLMNALANLAPSLVVLPCYLLRTKRF